MQKIGVLFLVEHVARELDVVTCLIHKLRSRHGINAAARGYYHQHRQNLTVFDPRVVVLPFFYGADHLQPVEYLTTWRDARIVNLGWEQILNKTDVGMKIPRDEWARTAVHHVCWTHGHKRFLHDNGVESANLALTGSPVMQLYADPYRRYFKTRRDLAVFHGIDSEKKWILFNESYQFAMFSEQHMKNLVDHQNADPALVAAAAKYSREGLTSLLRWVSELAERDVIFILRPRPSTTEGEMVKFMDQVADRRNPNVRIIQAETAREWILAADHVMSSHSTTLIEAALAGKPIHRFSPEPPPDAIALEWHNLVPLLSDRAGLGKAMGEAPPISGATLLAEWACTEFLGCGDAMNAIADCIARLHDVKGKVSSGRARYAELDHGNLWDGEGVTRPIDIFSDAHVDSRLGRWRTVLSDWH